MGKKRQTFVEFVWLTISDDSNEDIWKPSLILMLDDNINHNDVYESQDSFPQRDTVQLTISMFVLGRQTEIWFVLPLTSWIVLLWDFRSKEQYFVDIIRCAAGESDALMASLNTVLLFFCILHFL